MMSYRFQTIISRLNVPRRHQQYQRLLWNHASIPISSIFTTASAANNHTRGKTGMVLNGLFYTCYCAMRAIILMSAATTVTAISICQGHNICKDDNAQEGNDSTTHSSSALLATSLWRQPQELSEHESTVTAQPQKENLHAPIGTLRIIHPNPYIQICYDTRTRNPIYVQYKLIVPPQRQQQSNDNHHSDNTSAIAVKKRRPNYHFYEDTSIEERYRSRNSYYHNSGYDRGHLAPAADFPSNDNDDDHHQFDMMKSTYNLCNISPQCPDLNRIFWNQLEQLIRQMAIKYYNEADEAVTYVTTGPIYLPSSQINDKTFQYTMMGIGKPPSLVMVPTHFFKVVVVLDKTETNILYFACFVLPNDPNITESTKNRSLQSFIVPWTDLETVTGLTFYPDLVDDHWKVYADQITRNLPPVPDTMPSSTIEGRQHLYLTDGKRSNSTTTAAMKQQLKLYEKLKHLCDKQACLPRKQQQSPRP